MSPDPTAAKKPSINLKTQNVELEDKLFEKLAMDYRLKEILHPFAVLERSKDQVLLGSTKDIASKIDYNFSLKSGLRELVGSIVGDRCIRVEVKTAENEFQAVKKRIDKKLIKQKEDQVILTEINEQINEGRCNLIPFPVKENKVRSELTIERHSLFAANTFKDDFRAYERKIKDPQTSEDHIFKVEIGDRTGQIRGVLKQKHQEAFYKLSQIWSEQNYHIEQDEKFLVGSLEISVYELVQKLRGDDAGHHYQTTMQLLKEMSSIRINIKKINIEDGTCNIQDFTLLSYEWNAQNFCEKTLRPKSDGVSIVRIKFSNFITNNFLKKNVKSLMLSPYFALKDRGRKGVAQLLYSMLDYELASKDKFHISLLKLSERLGITQYRFKSKRLEKIASSINMVNGVKILDGKYKIETCITEAEDKKDWVLIARRAQS